MIPKVGDMVAIDLQYEDELMEDQPDDFAVLTSPLKVVHVSEAAPGVLEVAVWVQADGMRVFHIDWPTGKLHGADVSAPALFMPTLHCLSGTVPPDPYDLPQYILDEAARP